MRKFLHVTQAQKSAFIHVRYVFVCVSVTRPEPKTKYHKTKLPNNLNPKRFTYASNTFAVNTRWRRQAPPKSPAQQNIGAPEPPPLYMFMNTNEIK